MFTSSSHGRITIVCISIAIECNRDRTRPICLVLDCHYCADTEIHAIGIKFNLVSLGLCSQWLIYSHDQNPANGDCYSVIFIFTAFEMLKVGRLYRILATWVTSSPKNNFFFMIKHGTWSAYLQIFELFCKYLVISFVLWVDSLS